MACGRPNAASMAGPRRCRKAPAAPGSSAIIGEPCERRATARIGVMLASERTCASLASRRVARSVRKLCIHELVYVSPVMTPAALVALPLWPLAWRQTLRDFRAGELRLLRGGGDAGGGRADRGRLLRRPPQARPGARRARSCSAATPIVASDQPTPPAFADERAPLGLRVGDHAPAFRAWRARREHAAARSRLVAVKAVERRLSAARRAARARRRRRSRATRARRARAPGTVWVDAGAARRAAAADRRRAAARRCGACAIARVDRRSSPTAAPAS